MLAGTLALAGGMGMGGMMGMMGGSGPQLSQMMGQCRAHMQARGG